MSAAGRLHDEGGLVLSGLDGGNPLAFLAALGTLRTLALAWPDDDVRMAWTARAHPGWRPQITASRLSARDHGEQQGMVVDALSQYLPRRIDDHSAAVLAQLAAVDKTNPEAVHTFFADIAQTSSLRHRDSIDWLSALSSDVCPEATSQLQTARRDYFYGNLSSIIAQCSSPDLDRSLFRRWDYADPLDNQSLHFDPTEDRRHAYQWHTPSGDPNRKKQGGMLGANRLALEAIPLFQSIGVGDKLKTRGFSGRQVNRISWTWPIWTCALSSCEMTSLLASSDLQAAEPDASALLARGIAGAFRCRRILVEQTPNFTPATAVF